MRILITLLALCVWVFADVPNGTAVTQTVTINSAYVSETTTDFLLQFKVPRTGDILANCTSAANVAMTNLNDTLRRARWVVYTADTLYVYAHTAKSTSANTVYRLHYGLSLNEVNTSSAFTNCGILRAWVDSTVDYASGVNLTSSTLGASTGVFAGALSGTAGGKATANTATLSGATSFYVSMVLKPSTFSGLQVIYSDRIDATQIFQLQILNGKLEVVLNAAEIIEVTSISSYMTVGSYSDIGVMYTGLNGTITLYINGIQRGTYSSAPSAMPTYTGFARLGWPSYGFIGVYDNVMVSREARSVQYPVDRYRTLFTSTFWTLGTPVPVDTLKLVTSPTNYDSLRWFDNNVATDSTDSTYTIYADSAFYAVKHVIYCMAYNAGGATKSGEWVFNGGTINRSRWDSFLRSFRYAYKRAFK